MKPLISYYTLVTLLLCIVEQAYPQSSGDSLSFKKWLTENGETVGVLVYFNESWISHDIFPFQGDANDSRSVLEQFCKANKLKLLSTEDGIYIYKGSSISTTLPEWGTVRSGNGNNLVSNQNKVTQSEQQYKLGRIVADLELIKVGSPRSVNTLKNARVRGRVIDNDSDEPILGATIYVEEVEKGAATDIDGYFSIPLRPGKYKTTVNCLSMRSRTFYLEVFSDGDISIPLEKELVSINEVQVVADKINNVAGIQMGFERISSKTMKEIPVIMGEKDLLKIAQMLPGVQSVGEGSAGINVRGGSADQNLFYINKLPVYNTAHLFGFFSAFNPDIINDFSLYKSNIPANFGGRLSSIFDISTRQGNKKEFYGKGGISPITGHIMLEGPLIENKSSVVLSYRTTYSDWILSRLDDVSLRESNASFYDISGVINTVLNKKNILKVFYYKSKDDFSLSSTNDYAYANNGTSVSLKHFYSQALSSDIAVVSSNYSFGHNNKKNPSEAFNQNYNLHHNELRVDFKYTSPSNHKISFGGSSILYHLNRGVIKPFNEESKRTIVDLGKDKGVENALYISDDFSPIPRLSILAGIRYNFFNFLGPTTINEYFENSPLDENNIKTQKELENNQLVKSYSGPEPRFAANYRLGTNSSLKTSYNRLRQNIFMLSNTIAISPTDQWKLADYHIKPATTDQLSIGYYYDVPKKGLESSLEIYQKWTKNIAEFKDGVDFVSGKPPEMQLLQGRQESRGIELMLKKNSGRLTGWLSYTYSKSTILVQNKNLPTQQINYGKVYPSNYDRPHSFNAVTNLRYSRRLSISANMVYYTGRPITYPESVYYSEGKQTLQYSGRNEYRLPNYFRLDLSINLEGNLNRKKWIHSYWMLNVYNLTGRKNAYSVYFESNEKVLQAYKLSIIGAPIFTVSWNFKFGNYVSE